MHKNNYPKSIQLNDEQILERAVEILAGRFIREDCFNNVEVTKEYVRVKLGQYEREVFAVLLLDNQHQLIEYQELFYGTIDAASVYPREVVKAVLQSNAAAIIFAHNHPSGITLPSQSDKAITTKLVEALKLIDVRVLDHFIVGKDVTSFAEQGLI